MFLTLPVPPSMNHMYERNKGGGVRRADAVKQFVEAVHGVFLKGVRPPYPVLRDRDVEVTLWWYRDPARHADLDNRQKVLFDALKHLAYYDDRQIVGIRAYRLTDADNPHVVVHVAPAGAWAQRQHLEHAVLEAAIQAQHNAGPEFAVRLRAAVEALEANGPAIPVVKG